MTIEELRKLDMEVWAIMTEAVKTGNLALIEKNLSRLYAVQEAAYTMLKEMSWNIELYKGQYQYEAAKNYKLEREWILAVSKNRTEMDKAFENIEKTIEDMREMQPKDLLGYVNKKISESQDLLDGLKK